MKRPSASPRKSSSSLGRSARRAPSASRNAQSASSWAATGESFCFARRLTGSHESGANLERARALADLGAQLRRRNRRTEARELLREALDIAHVWMPNRSRSKQRPTCARRVRGRVASSSRGLESLTASERRIAEIASQGLTNREIAQTLFITTRTVEGHLTSVFRKLQLDSRNELQTALAGDARITV